MPSTRMGRRMSLPDGKENFDSSTSMRGSTSLIERFNLSVQSPETSPIRKAEKSWLVSEPLSDEYPRLAGLKTQVPAFPVPGRKATYRAINDASNDWIIPFPLTSAAID